VVAEAIGPMKTKHTVVALVILLGLGAYVAVFERGEKPVEGQILNFDVKSATKLEVVRGSDTLVIEKQGDDWVMTQPVKGVANPDTVENMIKALARFKPTGSREGEDLNDAHYGLTNAAIKATAWFGSRKVSLHIGAETAGSEFYASIPGDPKLYFVSSMTKTDLEKKPEDLRDKNVARFKLEEVRRFQVQFDGNDIAMENDPEPGETKQIPGPNHWTLTQPVKAKASTTAADDLVRKVQNLMVEEFVDSPASGDDPYGFAKPSVKAIARLEKGNKEITVIFGKEIEKKKDNTSSTTSTTSSTTTPQKLVYCQRMGRDEVFLVKADVLKDLRKTANDLRDKKLAEFEIKDVEGFSLKRRDGASFTGKKAGEDWQVSAGSAKAIKADKFKTEDLLYDTKNLEAAEFIEKPGALSQYGLDKPAITLELSMARGKKPVLVKIGNKEGDKYYAQVGDDASIVRVLSTSVDRFPKAISDFQAEAPKKPDSETGVDSSKGPASVPMPPKGDSKATTKSQSKKPK